MVGDSGRHDSATGIEHTVQLQHLVSEHCLSPCQVIVAPLIFVLYCRNIFFSCVSNSLLLYTVGEFLMVAGYSGG